MLICLNAVAKKWHDEYYAKRNGTYVEPEPGFLKQAYNSWKEKTCHKIVFTVAKE